MRFLDLMRLRRIKGSLHFGRDDTLAKGYGSHVYGNNLNPWEILRRRRCAPLLRMTQKVRLCFPRNNYESLRYLVRDSSTTAAPSLGMTFWVCLRTELFRSESVGDPSASVGMTPFQQSYAIWVKLAYINGLLCLSIETEFFLYRYIDKELSIYI